MMPYDIPYDIQGQFIPQYANLEDGGANILFAPITLTRQANSDYLDVVYRVAILNANGQPVRTVEMTAEQFAEAQKDRNFRGQPEAFKYVFKPAFFNSMFYKTFVGTQPELFGQTADGNDVLSAMNYAAQVAQQMTTGGYQPVGPAAGLEHFRLVFAQGNAITSSIQDSLRITEYYRGALVQGQVMSEDGETPIANATVVAFDDAGKILFDLLPRDYRTQLRLPANLTPDDLNVGHARVQADAQGRFSIRVPFNLSADEKGLGYITLAAYRGTGDNLVRVGTTKMVVTREDANPVNETAVFNSSATIVVRKGTLTGQLYEDVDRNGVYNASAGDLLLPNATFRLGSTTVNTDANGNYTVQLNPDIYTVNLTALPGGRNAADYVARNPQVAAGTGNVTANIAVVLREVAYSGNATWVNATAPAQDETRQPLAAGTRLTFEPAAGVADNTARTNFTTVLANGNYTIRLVPGTYNVTALINGSTYQIETTLVVPRASTAPAEGVDRNFVLYRRA